MSEERPMGAARPKAYRARVCLPNFARPCTTRLPNMSKKPGQISSNTLSLRFMQNAAKARQESEFEAANAKVRTDEEWELSPDVKQSWGIGDGEVKDHG